MGQRELQKSISVLAQGCDELIAAWFRGFVIDIAREAPPCVCVRYAQMENRFSITASYIKRIRIGFTSSHPSRGR
jgi:hypothetical protein